MRPSKVFIFLLLLLAVPVAAVFDVTVVQVASETKTISAAADSYVVDEFPDWNTGREQWLWVERKYDERITFLMFDLSGVPSDASVESAKLRLQTSRGVGNVGTNLVGVYYCPNNDWTEDGIIYNNKPEFSSTGVDTVNVTAPETWYEWNVTTTVRSAVTAADKRLSLALNAETGAFAVFYSRSYTDAPPQLVMSYSAPSATGIDPLVIGIAAIALGVVAAGLAVTYMRFKRKKPKTPISRRSTLFSDSSPYSQSSTAVFDRFHLCS